MKIGPKYSRIEAMHFVLDHHDLRRAAIELARQSTLWPKKQTEVLVDFGDDEDGNPYCEVVAKYVYADEPESADAVDPDGGKG